MGIQSGVFLQSLHIGNHLLNMYNLKIRQVGDFEKLAVVQAEEIVGCYREKSGKMCEHLHRRLYIIIFPMGNALFGNMQASGQIYRTDAT